MNEQTFATVAGLLPEALLLVRNDGEIVSGNRPAADLLEVPLPSLIGRRLEALEVPPGGRVRRILQMGAGTRPLLPGRVLLRPDAGHPVDLRVEVGAWTPAAEGERATVLVRLAPYKSDRDRFILLTRKIDELTREMRRRLQLETEREELLQSEQEARLAAEKANRMKDEFLAVMSHELRTPLQAIVSWSSMLSSGELGEQHLARGIETIHRLANAQARLIDDLLDISRIVTGTIRLDVEPVPLADAVQGAVETALAAAADKEIQLETRIDPRAGHVHGDPHRIQQVVWNLLSNAVKFTPSGGTVEVDVSRNGSVSEIVVTDTGEGIDPSFLPFIFDPFRQEDSSLTRKHDGLGIGLAISRHVAELHGGKLRAESEGRGRGATFTLSLPTYTPAIGPGSGG